MGRWLNALREEEKNLETSEGRPLKTLKTSPERVLRVLRVPPGAVSKNFFRHDESAGEGFEGFEGSSTGAFAKTFHPAAPASDPPAASLEERRAAVARLLDAMRAENERRRDWWREPVEGWSEGKLTLRSAVTGETMAIKLPKRRRS